MSAFRRSRLASPFVLFAVLAATLAGPARARDHDQTLVCPVSQYASQPGAAPSPQMLIYSVLSLTNPNADGSIRIGEIAVFDRNGSQLCAYSAASPLPVKAFDPARPFDFTEPLGPYQTLNVMTARLPCIPWPVVTTANANDLMGTLTVRITWTPDGPGRWIAPLLGKAAVIYADIATGRTDATRSSECVQVWP